MAGSVEFANGGTDSLGGYMKKSDFDAWAAKQQSLQQTAAQPNAQVYQSSYSQPQQFSPLQSWAPPQIQQQSPFGFMGSYGGGYGMRSPFGMMSQFGGGYGQMGYGQQFGGYGMQSPFGGMGSGFGMGGMGYGDYGMQTPFSSGYGMGYGGYQQPRPQYGGQQVYGNYGQPRGGFNSTYADPKPVRQFSQQNPWSTGIPRPEVQANWELGDPIANDAQRAASAHAGFAVRV